MKTLQDLLNLALDMGRVIRSLDEEGDYSELWANDGDYVPDSRFTRAQEVLKASRRTTIGQREACRYCGHDIEFLGRGLFLGLMQQNGWRDRGSGRDCLPYTDRKTREVITPKTKHAPPKKGT